MGLQQHAHVLRSHADADVYSLGIKFADVDFGGDRRKSIIMGIESNLATKKCIADALFLRSG